MAWLSDSNEQVQNNWETRSAKKRDELSRSIEETLAVSASLQEPISDEEDELVQHSKNSIIIPPKLSLQSKPMPVVRIESTDVTTVASTSTTDAVSVPSSTQKKQRLAGRTTRVQLQAVPKPEKKSSTKLAIDMGKDSIDSEPERHMNGKNSSKRQSSSDRGALAKGKVDRAGTKSLAGSGYIKHGQRDVMITNSHVSSSSIINVTLVEDPGPVVVKYISLHPQTGFTLHFSDAAEFDARFNYAILMGELF